MTHRFPIKEIARQSGLGAATVDRVLNNRSHVSPQTRNRVEAAIEELVQQEQQLAARGRRLFVDIVVEAPERFTAEIRQAAEAVLPSIGFGIFRPRFLFQEIMSDADIETILARIAKRGSHGVCLKARDIPVVRQMVDRLTSLGIPVVTLATDIPGTARTAYVGVDNANAGRTAAYLMASAAKSEKGVVLATRSQEEFYGEIERYTCFCETLAELMPGFEVLNIAGGAGLASATTNRLTGVLEDVEDLTAIYSVGGGNDAIVRLLAEYGYADLIYVAHDLDRDNRKLIEAGAISFVLHHDLKTDMRNLFLAIAAAHRLAPPTKPKLVSDVQVITPFNLPV
ncbi:MAG: LacI family DNA-binding transcriptional regulator [Stappiaceae bacterium]